MRILEMILVTLSFSLLMNIWFFNKWPKKMPILLSALGGVTLAGHFIWEGARWQLLFIYMILVALIGLLLFRISGKTLRLWKPVRFLLHTLMVLLMVCSALLAVYLPVFKLPEPDGPYKVGTDTMVFTDRDRDETITENKTDKRKLLVQIWYPAEDTSDTKESRFFPYDDKEFKTYKEAFANQMHVPPFLFDYFKYIKTNSNEGAKIASGSEPFPVVLISHGAGTGRNFHTSQAENLASHGFIAVAIDHTYSTMATVFPDGTVTDFKTGGIITDFFKSSSKYGKIWLKDLQFAIDQLEVLNSGSNESRYKEKIDMNRIGIMGHSFGGATAFHAVNKDDRIKAGINMDGTLYGLDKDTKASKPFLFIQGEWFASQKKEIEQGKAKRGNLTEAEFNEIMDFKKKEYQAIENSLNANGAMISIKGTEHYNFTDLQLFSDLLSLVGFTGKIDSSRSSFIVNQYILDFFNKELKEKEGSLMDKQNNKFPEVTIY